MRLVTKLALVVLIVSTSNSLANEIYINQVGNLFDATNFASELDLPVLCILAKSDKMTPINLGIKMAHTIKDAKFVEIAKSGHMIPLEKPDEVNSEILNFIK